MHTLIGRTDELDRLRAHLARAAAGTPVILLVHGPAGVGKTALLRGFLNAHPEVAAGWISCDPAEASIGGGVLEQVWRVSGRSRPTPARQDPVAAGADLLDLFSGVDDAVRVLVVDDVQWADGASLQAMTFALRRLRVERVLVVLTCRDPLDSGLPEGLLRLLDDADRSIGVTGLATEELLELAVERGRPAMSARTADRLRAHTDGNPLHALALLREYDDLAGAAPDAPLPAPRSYATLVTDRSARLAPAARALVEAASVLGVRTDVTAALTVAGIEPGLGADALGALVAEELAEVNGTTLAFVHPLTQAAVYHGIEFGRRATLHRRAAEQCTGTDRLRHRVAATSGADPGLAAESADHADTLAVRGDWAMAAVMYGAARRLAADPEVAVTHLLDQFEALVACEDRQGIRALQPEVEALPSSPHRDLVLGELAVIDGDRAVGMALLVQAYDQATAEIDAGGDAREDSGTPVARAELVAAKAATAMSIEALNDGLGEDAVRWSERALAAPTFGMARALPHCIRAQAHVQVGDLAAAEASVATISADSAGLSPEHIGAVLGRGIVRVWSDRPGEALDDLTLADRLCLREGSLYLRIMALLYRAEARYRLGDWDEADADAQLAVSLSVTAGFKVLGVFATSVGACTAAAVGRTRIAHTRVRRATAEAAELADVASTAWATIATVRTAHADRDPAPILAACAPWWEVRDLPGVLEPGILRWTDWYAEALLETGDVALAEQVLDAAEPVARARDNRVALRAMLRVRARIAEHRTPRDLRTVDLAFQRVVGSTPRGRDARWEDALVLLSYGEWLRRSERTDRAVEVLTTARTIFERVGAAPYLERTVAELEACGVRATPSVEASDLRRRLTPQELVVCTLVASGLDDQEIAHHLVLGPKTVRFHLLNAARKLGARNRAEVAVRLAPSQVGGTGSPEAAPGESTSVLEVLSAAELRVATLVAEGLTNAQIAERLVVSRRTVDSHVAASFKKLGVTSRVALTRLVLESTPA